MARVIHTGDTHLGYRQYHSRERRADFLDAFRRVVEDAVADEVDAVVHAGDLFHDRTPALADVHGAIQVLSDLRDAGVPFLAVVGNHERTRGSQWLDLFETLGLATRLGSGPVRVGNVAVYGLDFVPRSMRDDLAYDFAPHDAEFAALVAHGLFTPFNPEWDTGAVLDASPVDFDAVLLGDDHQPDTARVDGTWVTYCGSTERTSAAERDERGYNIVEFDDEVRISRRGLETRRFVPLDLALAPGEGLDRVRERIREEDVEDAVVVVRITGDGEEVPPARVEEFATDRGALVARVSDRREAEAAEATAEVSFVDPDEAVRERVRQLGFSDAAAVIDETVRERDVADANVRDRVRERVEDLVEDDPAALEPHEPGPAADETVRNEGAPEGAAADETAPGDDATDDKATDATGAPAEPAAPGAAAGAAPGEDAGAQADDPEPGTGGDGGGDGGAGERGSADEPGEEGGGTTTIEDFL